MYKVKGKPWTYSGAIDVSDCATVKEVMLKAGLNFNVAKCELVGKMPIKLTGTDEELDRIIKEQKEGAHVFGTDIYRKCDNAFATYRTDYNIPLGVVKSKYTIVQNNDAFNFFDGAIGKNSAIWQTAGFCPPVPPLLRGFQRGPAHRGRLHPGPRPLPGRAVYLRHGEGPGGKDRLLSGL